MMFWSVGPFWYMEYGMKMAFTVYLHMFCMRRARAVHILGHLFLGLIKYLLQKLDLISWSDQNC